VLCLTTELADRYGEPVPHEVLEWFTDMADRNHDPDGALTALDNALGTRPTRSSLFVVLGDLVDKGLLLRDPAGRGFFVSGEGRTLAKELQQRAPTFEHVI